MSFLNKLSEKDGYKFELVKGKDESGKDSYAFVLFTSSSFREFLDDSAGNIPVKVEDYGIIVAQGYGTATDADIQAAKKKFQEEYLK